MTFKFKSPTLIIARPSRLFPHSSSAVKIKMSATSKKSDSGKTYHTECTGDALVTVKAHEKDEDITLFGSCFCPFVQRVWMTFEILGIPYKVWILLPISYKFVTEFFSVL